MGGLFLGRPSGRALRGPRREKITMTRCEETEKVKAALRAAGMTAKVRHGTGTACEWLKIKVEGLPPLGEHEWQAKYAEVQRIAQQATGRSGEYGGRINIDLA